MTAIRIADIRAALTQGRWGYTRRRSRALPDCHGSLWLRVDETVQGLRYAGLSELDPERMEQLVALDGMARDLLAWGDALRLERDELRAELERLTAQVESEVPR